jgi:hypothetical protein
LNEVRQLLQSNLEKEMSVILDYLSKVLDDHVREVYLEWHRDIMLPRFAAQFESGEQIDEFAQYLHKYLRIHKLIRMLDEGASETDILIEKLSS